LEVIKQSAFDCCWLKSISFPETLASIDVYAFSCCSASSYHIPKKVNSIGNGAFSHNTLLESITVSEDNKCFKAVDGVLYNINLSILYCYPMKLPRNPKLLLSLVEIKHRGFCSQSIEQLHIPRFVTTLAESSFFFCSKLTQIIISGNIISISESITFQCPLLKNIYYEGNKEVSGTKFKTNFNVYACYFYPSSTFGNLTVRSFSRCPFFKEKTPNLCNKKFYNSPLFSLLITY
jgi:hypothetical protein